jgi:hypothetical protein
MLRAGSSFLQSKGWIELSDRNLPGEEIMHVHNDPSGFNPTISDPTIRLVRIQNSIISDGDTGTWERVYACMTNIPVETTYIAIGIGARENVTPDSSPELDGHYGDNVSVYWESVPAEAPSWGVIKSLYE